MKSAFGRNIRHTTIWLETLMRERGEGASLGLIDHVQNGVTAIAAVSDLHALRVLTELQTAGIKVPQQVSVTGFDDLIFSPVVTPSLTTVHMDMARIAELAIAALVCEIEQAKSTAPTGKTLKRTVNADISKVSMELMVRASSGPAVSPDAPFPTGETL